MVDDFHVIRKPICHFLLMINSNLSPISHSLATVAHNCLQNHPRTMISI